MSNKQKKILEAVFKAPIPINLKYTEIISMLRWLGAEVIESKNGSRVLLCFRGQTLVIHKPHPQKEVKQYAIKIIREFLTSAGVKI